MFIKLLCVKTVNFKDPYGNIQFTVEEGDEVGAMIERQGIHFEYEANHYSLPYRFEDVEDSFISAFDKEEYNRIYKNVNNCTMYFEDGTICELGNVRIKVEN